jgi:hypothetical protein
MKKEKLVFQKSKGQFVKGLRIGYKVDEVTGSVSTYIDTIVTRSLEEAAEWTSERTEDFDILVFPQEVDWMFPGATFTFDYTDFVVLTYHPDNEPWKEVGNDAV